MVRKKIAIIGLKGLPPFGGAANVGDNILEQLAGEYDFTVYSTASHTSVRGAYKGAQQIVFGKFPIKALNIFYYYIASAFHAVFRRKFDLVHLHQMDGAFSLLLLRLKYRVICTSHGLPYETGKWSKILYPYFKLNEWLQARLSSHLTVVSHSLISHYATWLSLNRITYIPNGITVKPLSVQLLDINDYVLFAAGRIISIKGLHFLLAALKEMEYTGKVIVLGDLTQREVYEKEIIRLSTGLNIEFRGLIKDKELLNVYIAQAKLFVFPSTQEAMSMMLLEVAALQIPVICSDIVQNTDIFNRDEMLFFESGNVTDLKEKLEWAIENPQALKSYSNKAYATLLEKYQWSAICKQYDALYKEFIK